MFTISGMIPLWASVQLWKHVGGTCGVSMKQLLVLLHLRLEEIKQQLNSKFVNLPVSIRWINLNTLNKFLLWNETIPFVLCTLFWKKSLLVHSDFHKNWSFPFYPIFLPTCRTCGGRCVVPRWSSTCTSWSCPARSGVPPCRRTAPNRRSQWNPGSSSPNTAPRNRASFRAGSPRYTIRGTPTYNSHGIFLHNQADFYKRSHWNPSKTLHIQDDHIMINLKEGFQKKKKFPFL